MSPKGSHWAGPEKYRSTVGQSDPSKRVQRSNMGWLSAPVESKKAKNKVTHLIVDAEPGARARFHIDRLLSTACVAGSTADGVVDRRHAESFGVWRVSHARQL